MTLTVSPWLNEDEILFHRMESFHRQRVEWIANGQSPLGKRANGILVIHFIPVASVRSRNRFEGSILKDPAASISAFGSQGRISRFNADGILNLDSREIYKGYSQIFRNGQVEAAMCDVSYELRPDFPSSSDQPQKTGPRALRDSTCEQAMFSAVVDYLQFCKKMKISAPIMVFSAIIGCEGVRICINIGFQDFSVTAIDRSPVHLPEFEITSFEEEPSTLLRPWCDTLWQAGGLERSSNFDQNGKWRERQR